jgi:hypothetical protein
VNERDVGALDEKKSGMVVESHLVEPVAERTHFSDEHFDVHASKTPDALLMHQFRPASSKIVETKYPHAMNPPRGRRVVPWKLQGVPYQKGTSFFEIDSTNAIPASSMTLDLASLVRAAE